jgi:Flp pilus assembly protein TadD
LTDSEQLAAAMTEQAHQATVRGDYKGALEKLDEAARIAPNFSRVAHYRSNIAWLMGDHAAAIVALKRAIELDPGNVLYTTNLKRLEETLKETH